MARLPHAFASLLLAFTPLFPLITQTHQPLATVPFVGCPADGQVGPETAPKGTPKHLPIPENIALQLAFYKGPEGPGVLGPRGWFCFETYGSGGSSLFIAPKPLNGISKHQAQLSGPAIEYSVSIGDTSGRFEVAKVAARVFPHLGSYVEDVIAEGLEPRSDFPVGPFPADKLTYKSDSLLEFTTPANATGLGTEYWLAKGPGDITGFAMITGEENNLHLLSMRLPGALTAVGPIIVEHAEHEASQTQP